MAWLLWHHSLGPVHTYTHSWTHMHAHCNVHCVFFSLTSLIPYTLLPIPYTTFPTFTRAPRSIIISNTGTSTLLAGLPSNTIGVIVIVWQLPCWSLLSTPLFLGINCIDTWGKCKDGRNVVYLLNSGIDKTFTLLCSGVRIFANNTLWALPASW